MSNELASAVVGVIVIVSRVLSHFEHKKTNKQVTDIHILLNGSLEDRIEKIVKQQLDEKTKT